jgi:predicted ATP-dependent serine protease
MPSPWLDASNPVAIDALIRRIEAHAARLVVIDNLGTVKGSTDENTGDMGQVMAQFRRVAETTGAALVVIHHQRKSNGSTGRAGDALRGHSSIEAALDLALLVEREDRSETGTVKATKARGADVAPFTFYFTYDRDQAGELQAARFFGIETDDADSDRAIDQTIIETVTAAHAAGQAVHQAQLVERVKAALEGVGVNRIRTRARLLADKGSILAIEGRPGTATTYGPARR